MSAYVETNEIDKLKIDKWNEYAKQRNQMIRTDVKLISDFILLHNTNLQFVLSSIPIELILFIYLFIFFSHFRIIFSFLLQSRKNLFNNRIRNHYSCLHIIDGNTQSQMMTTTKVNEKRINETKLRNCREKKPSQHWITLTNDINKYCRLVTLNGGGFHLLSVHIECKGSSRLY